MEEQHFTRERLLPFGTVTIMILTGWKMSIQNRVNKFFKKLGKVNDIVTASAFCQARKKIKPELFKSLNKELLDFYYDKYDSEGFVEKWNGHLLWAVDGSYTNIPDTPETRKKYFIQSNQYAGECIVQGLCSCLYDVLNELVINTELSGDRVEKNFIFNNHINYYLANSIIIYDRGYSDYSVIATHIKKNIHFVIRVPSSFTFKKVIEFSNSDKLDEIVTIKVTEKQKKFIKDQGLPEEAKVRLLKIELDYGTFEILITSLLDREKYKLEEFKWLYKQRWGVETHFDRFKNLLEAERFSSTHLIGIEQDFYGLMFLSNLESVLIKEDQREITERNRYRDLKYKYKINKSVSYCSVSDYIVEIFLATTQSLKDILEELGIMLKKNLVPERPGRKFERRKKTPSQKLRYYKYYKRVWA